MKLCCCTGFFPVEAKNILRLEEVVYNWEPPLDFYNLAWKKKMKTHQFEFLYEALLISQCSEAWPLTNNLVFAGMSTNYIISPILSIY